MNSTSVREEEEERREAELITAQVSKLYAFSMRFTDT